MPHPGARFPIPPFQWPHVGQQWPAWNIESDQAEGLLAWWPTLASHGGNVLRDLVAGRDGTWFGGAWLSDDQIGPMWDGDGASQYISMPGLALPTAYPFSISIWVRFSAAQDDAAFNFGSTAHVNPLAMLQETGGQIKYFVRNIAGTNSTSTSTSGSEDGIPHLIMGVSHASNDHRIFVDGIQEDSDNVDVSFPEVNIIGYGATVRAAISSHWPEQLGEARIYNRALSTNDAEQLFDPATRWELHPIPRRLWRLGVVAPPPATIVPVAMHHYRRRRL